MNTLFTWYGLGTAAAKVLLIFVFLVALWVIIDKLTKADDEAELFVKRNPAYAVVRISIVIAQFAALSPLISDTTGDFWYDVRPVLGWGAGVTVVFLLLNALLNKVLGRTDGIDALVEESMSDSIIKGGFYIATGLIFGSALQGSAPDLATAVAATVVFGLLGVAGLVLSYFLVSLLPAFRGRRQDKTVAAAIVNAGLLIGLGWMLNLAIAGDFAGWADGLIGFVTLYVLGLVLLVLMVFVVDIVLIRSRKLSDIVRDNEVIAATIMATLIVIVGATIGTVAI